MGATHTLIIKGDVEEPNNSDLFSYDIRCPAVSDDCRMWVECDIPNCAHDNGHDAGEVFHGKRHQYIAGSWSVPTDTCYLLVADEMPDAAAFLAGKEHLEAGEYEIGHDFDEGRIADFHLAKEPTR